MPDKILIIDDDVDSLKLIGLMLQKRGYQIVVANTGAQGLGKAAAEHPDLIVLDVMMPDVDGYEVCRRLRAAPDTGQVPIIMFSAKSNIDDKVMGFEAGADDYLTKPTHPDELITRVQALLSRHVAAQGEEQKAIVTATLAVKGGMGVSTLAVNIAAAFAQLTEAIFVDFRPGMGSVGLELGFSRSTGIANLVSKQPDMLTPHIVAAELVTHDSGLRLLLSSARPIEAQLRIAPEVAEAIVRQLAVQAGAVVLDLGTGLGRLNLALVRQATQTLVVVEPHRTALLMTRELLLALKEAGLGPDRLGVVLVNRAETPVQLAWQEAEQLLEHELLAIIAPAVELAFRAAEAGAPMILHKPNSVAANQFSRLAAEIRSRAQATTQS